MRPLIVFSTVTLDGFMTGPDNDLDYMVVDDQLDEELVGSLRSVVDTIVVGRVSFSEMAGHWSAAEGTIAEWMNRTPKVVLSTNADFDVNSWENSTLAAGDGAEHVRRLKAADGGALVVFGGTNTVRSLVTADLVDEYWLRINPVVVGRGGSMFSDLVDRRSLTLRSARSHPSGVVAAIYEQNERQS